MPDLIRSALPLLIPALLPVFLLLLAPLCGRRGRTVIGATFLLLGLAFVADVLISDHTAVQTLKVPNPFPSSRGPGEEVWVVDTVSAPAWHWHIAMAGVLVVLGVAVLARRNRPPHAPQPGLYGAGIGVAWLGTRLLLEKTAAGPEVVWAIGLDFALLLILPFVGWYSGARGMSWKGLLGQLLLMALLQRGILVAIAYWATAGAHGTHLDVHLVTHAGSPFGGELEFGGDTVKAWLWLMCFPQTFWAVATVVAGLVLGIVPLKLAQRRAAARVPAFA